MSSPDREGPMSRMTRRTLFGLAGAGTLALAASGCGFRPLYGDASVTGGPAARDQLAAIDVQPIEGRIGTPEGRLAVEVRNALIYQLQGGGGGQTAAYRLDVKMQGTLAEVIPNVQTGRREVETYGIDASFVLTEIGSGKRVMTGNATSRVSFNSPGEQQRFARARGLRDAEDRAAQTLAEQIKLKLASHFAAAS